jgi:hypothetical protein
VYDTKDQGNSPIYIAQHKEQPAYTNYPNQQLTVGDITPSYMPDSFGHRQPTTPDYPASGYSGVSRATPATKTGDSRGTTAGASKASGSIAGVNRVASSTNSNLPPATEAGRAPVTPKHSR